MNCAYETNRPTNRLCGGLVLADITFSLMLIARHWGVRQDKREKKKKIENRKTI